MNYNFLSRKHSKQHFAEKTTNYTRWYGSRGLPRGSGRETPAAPGVSGGSTWGVSGPSLSGLPDPPGQVQASGCSESCPQNSPSLPQFALVPTWTTWRLPKHSSCPGLAQPPPSTVRSGWHIRTTQAHGRKEQPGATNHDRTTDQSTGAARGEQRPSQESTLGSRLGPLPRRVQRPRSKAQRCYSLARDLRQKAELPGLADPGGRGAGGGEGQGPAAVPATRGINGLITHPIKSCCDLESLPVRPWNSGTRS